MIVRKTNSSVGSHHREGAGSSTGPAPKSHLVIPEPRSVGSEFRNQAGDNLANAGRLVFIGVQHHGLGTIAMPFLFRSFHGGSYGDNRA